MLFLIPNEWRAWPSRIRDYPISVLTGRPAVRPSTFGPEFTDARRDVTSMVEHNFARVLLLIN